MADPFEVRMRFTSQLQHLSASVNSSQKTAHFALKYRDMDEDLHSCILEQLERSSTNNRANIMYFIEHLCDMAQREGHLEFVSMMQRDILRIVDAVAPADGTGAANVKVVRTVLSGLQRKSYLKPETVYEIEEGLKERDASGDGAGSPTLQTDIVDVIKMPGQPASSDPAVGANGTGNFANKLPVVSKPDKKQIEQRIEEDRERHKRLREEIWAIGSDRNPNEEYERLRDETSSFGSDDHILAQEEADERQRALDMG